MPYLLSAHYYEPNLCEDHELNQDDTVVWTHRNFDDEELEEEALIEFMDHLWIPIFLIHSDDCPCTLDLVAP